MFITKVKDSAAFALIVALSISAGAAAIGGCKDKSTTPTVKEAGDLNDPVYLYVSEGSTSQLVASEGAEWIESLIEYYLVVTDTRARRVSYDTVLNFSYSVDDETKWVTLQGSIISGGNSAEARGSVRFIAEGGGYLIPTGDTPLELIYGIEIVGKLRIHLVDHPEFIGVIAMRMSESLRYTKGYNWYPTVGDTLWLNSSSDDTIIGTFLDGMYGSCEVNIASKRRMENLTEVIGQADACPVAGSAVLMQSIDITCATDSTQFTVNGSWSISATFHGGDYSERVVENERYRWSEQVHCADGVSSVGALSDNQRFVKRLIGNRGDER